MSLEALQLCGPGLGATVQDLGRPGWRRFGVPTGGALDEHAMSWANRLLDNPAHAPVVELLLQGARFSVLRDVWIAVTGAEVESTVPLWKAVRVRRGESIEFLRNRSGVWNYLAIEGGFAATRFFGSASALVRGGIGAALKSGDILAAAGPSEFHLPEGVASRVVPPFERRHYDRMAPLRVWPAPQTGKFSPADRDRFFAEPWRVTSQSDRVGYRLAGTPLNSKLPQLVSEPVRVGTIQVPESGQPIVTLRDGPTVGGYSKLGMLDPADVSWLVQCRPGQTVRFRPVTV